MRFKTSSMLAALVLAMPLTQAAAMPRQSQELLAQAALPQSQLPGTRSTGIQAAGIAIATAQSQETTIAVATLKGILPTPEATFNSPASATAERRGTTATGSTAIMATATSTEAPAPSSSEDSKQNSSLIWLWWLLPLAILAALLWALSRKRDSADSALDEDVNSVSPEPSIVPTAVTPPIAAEPGIAQPEVLPLTEAVAAVAAAPPTDEATAQPLETPSTPDPVEAEPLTASTSVEADIEPPVSEIDQDQEPTPASEIAPIQAEPTVADPIAPLTDEPVATINAANQPPFTPPAKPPQQGSEYPPNPSLSISAVIVGAEGLAAGATAIINSEEEAVIEASKYNVVGRPVNDLDLSNVDQGLADLPSGYGESRIVLLPRDPQWAYAYWDIPNEHKEDLRRQGGQRLALRLYDVTDIDLATQACHSLQQYDCEELARDWYLPIPVSDRDYLAEIGYLSSDGRWLLLAQSNPIHIPPVYPSDWVEDDFLTVNWTESLQGKTFITLIPPSQKQSGSAPLHENLFGLAQQAEAFRVAGSLFGSLQHVPGSLVPQQSVSSYIFPSGMGLWSLPTLSGALPTSSGMGFAASIPPIRPRKFWLVADAELIVYGATEPDATVTIGGQPIQLSSDGTFRFQMSFQDGTIDYPIMAVALDGEQTRSIHMEFERETPERRTNTREDAQDEWLP